MSSNYGRGYTTFGGADGTPSDKTTVDLKVTVPGEKGDNDVVQPNYMNDGDKVGIESGLNEQMSFNANTEVGPTYNYAEDPMTGNFQERPNPYDRDKSVTGKGKTFSIDR